jgi:putative oxidoreductase
MNNIINNPMLHRGLIALLFIVAGFGKITGFEGTTGYVTSLLPMFSSLAMLITAAVIFIEIVVAAVWVWGGYKKDEMGWVLIAFTAIATLLVHNNISDQTNMIMALKNIAIIGGILATIGHKNK